MFNTYIHHTCKCTDVCSQKIPFLLSRHWDFAALQIKVVRRNSGFGIWNIHIIISCIAMNEAVKHNLNISHWTLDGYYKNTCTVYENYCCCYISHHCILQLRDQPIDNQVCKLNSRYAETNWDTFLRNTCKMYVVSIRECQSHKQVKNVKKIQTFLTDHCSDIEELLRPKHAFKDGECLQAF